MDETEYMGMADEIPDSWYTSQESVEITKGIFYDIMIGSAMRENMVISSNEDMRELLLIMSEQRGVPVEEIIQDTQNIALTVGAVRLFNEKYPHIAKKFETDEYGNPRYPPKFLAKILGVTEDIAHELSDGVLIEYSVYLKPEPG